MYTYNRLDNNPWEREANIVQRLMLGLGLIYYHNTDKNKSHFNSISH